MTATTASRAEFIASNWKELRRNTLQGFFSVELPSGLIIHNLTLHQKNDARWCGMPARSYELNGETKWSPIIEFTDDDTRRQFQERVLCAVDRLLDGGQL